MGFLSTRAAALILAVLATGCNRNPRSYLDAGDRLLAAAKYDDAAILYRKALAKGVPQGDAYFKLGLLEMERHRGYDAHAFLSRAAALLPANTEIQAKLGELSLALYLARADHPKSLYEQADTIAGGLLTKDAGSFDGLRLKGALLLEDRKPKEALRLLELANAGRAGQPEVLLLLAQALFQDGRAAEGERLGMELARTRKTFGPIYDVLYYYYEGAQRESDAEKILWAKAESNPGEASYILQLAQHYARSHQPQAVRATLERLLGDRKTFPDAYLQVGDFYAGWREWQEAAREYETGERSDPQRTATYELRMVKLLAAQGRAAAAMERVEAAWKRFPKDGATRAMRAAMLLDRRHAGDAEVAAPELEDLVKQNPQDFDLHFQLGRAYAARNDLDLAAGQFRAAANRPSGFVEAWTALALIYLSQGKPGYALEPSEQILRSVPQSPTARLLHAMVLTDLEVFDNATAELGALLRDVPGYTEARLQLGFLYIKEKEYEHAEAAFMTAARADKSERPALGLTENYVAQHQYDKAIGILQGELKKSAGTIAVLGALGQVALSAGETGVAIRAYEQVLAIAPKSTDARVQLGRAYQLQGDGNRAIAILDEAHQLAPKDVSAAAALASALEQAGRVPEAINNYREVLLLAPNNAFALNNLAYLLAEHGGNLDEALRLAQRSVRQSPETLGYQDTLAWIYAKRNLADSALRILQQLVQRQPYSPTYRHHLAVALLTKGERSHAKSELENALHYQPTKAEENQIKELLAKIG